VKKTPPAWKTVVIQSIRIPFVLLVLFPFLIVAVNIHPQRIRCLGTPAKLGMQFEDVTLTSDGIPLSACTFQGDDAGPALSLPMGWVRTSRFPDAGCRIARARLFSPNL